MEPFKPKSLEELMGIKSISDLDQIHESLRRMAEIMGFYYKALTTNGIPHDLAMGLVSDFHGMNWNKAFWPKSEG